MPVRAKFGPAPGFLGRQRAWRSGEPAPAQNVPGPGDTASTSTRGVHTRARPRRLQDAQGPPSIPAASFTVPPSSNSRKAVATVTRLHGVAFPHAFRVHGGRQVPRPHTKRRTVGPELTSPTSGLLPAHGCRGAQEGLQMTPSGPVLTALECPVLPSIRFLHPATTARHTERTGAWPIVTSATTQAPGTGRRPSVLSRLLFRCRGLCPNTAGENGKPTCAVRGGFPAAVRWSREVGSVAGCCQSLGVRLEAERSSSR
ncbi:uncharacterized protein LOC124985655 [Sciurus carolinensis]|nr:uncharacterized protein LOC124985655 [Sciurus carolinensis]